MMWGRRAAAVLCLVVCVTAAWAVTGAGATLGSRTIAIPGPLTRTPTTASDPTVENNDFQAWIPIAIGIALVAGVGVLKARR